MQRHEERRFEAASRVRTVDVEVYAEWTEEIQSLGHG